MTEKPPAVNRRRFVQATMTSAAVLGGITTADARKSSSSSQYFIEQDGKCIPIEPISKSGLPVTKFYDFRTPYTHPSSFKYASIGTENLQRKNTSILFLFKGPKGLSLVAVHDKVDSGTGGAATFRITNLPANGEIAVKDDKYPAQTNYDQWKKSTYRNSKGKKFTTLEASWAHGKKRTDGIAYRGLGDDFNFTIYPQFNGQAILSDKTHGNINRWEVLSGDVTNPTRTKLDMSKPVTISSKPCQSKTTKARKTTQTTQKPTQRTTRKKSMGSGKTTTSSKPSHEKTGKGQSVFDQVWDSVSSVFGSITSFFTSLF